MGKAMFYHLTQDPLEVTARALLARAYAQGMRVAVRGRDAAALERLDQMLWLGEKEAFLPHGLAGTPHDAHQPILLTTAQTSANDPSILMLVDRSEARPDEVAGLERVWIVFNGADPDDVAHARTQWKAMVAACVDAEYWSQDSGRWTCKAQSSRQGDHTQS